ncbi:hypothetical protein AWH69_02860 [Janibacter melonis]|uniref:DUF3152 domain-containing protein n=1 Tax=Janibacter melonis TaxID=262209 RepID=A0A176QGD8_9MICO|nr:DUF3152 domain-containing protein [Janibacter melonis]OAB88742.1 hypothetical protein AWH69_02860 [Janibacter melonis]
MTTPAEQEPPAPSRDRGWVVLVALTVVGLVLAVLATRSAGPGQGAQPAASTSSSSSSTSAAGPTATSGPKGEDVPPATASPTRRDPRVVERGNGRLAPVAVRARASTGSGRVVRWSLEAEQGLGIDLDELSDVVARTLADRRGWQRADDVRLVHVPAWRVARGEPVQVRITLASPRTTDRLCAPLTTRGEVSCWQSGRAVLNSRRWLTGAPAYRGRLADYRTYLVNHEVGHGLGHGHEGCAGPGRRAPVMMQQTLGVGRCTAWPYPVGDGSQLR